MTDSQLHAAANALAAKISNEITALARRRAAPLTEGHQAIAARAAALAAERQRRDCAGVRVRASADDLNERLLVNSGESFALAVEAMTQNLSDVGNLTALLSKALAMIADMSDALTAPERVAAEAERVADAAALAADRAEDERSARAVRDVALVLARQRAEGHA
jgi:hypothetical protein